MREDGVFAAKKSPTAKLIVASARVRDEHQSNDN